jgi:NTE family protein
MKYDLVCEGGGAKGVGLVGAITAIEQRGFTPSHLAGTSAGSIVASLRAAGYTPEELKAILYETDFNTFKDGNGFGRKGWNIFKHRGIYEGEVFYQYIKQLLAAKGVVYFGDLLSENGDLLNYYRWRFKCYVADVSNKRLVTFPDDAELYGLKPDNMEVALAVRCSMGIPIIFQPVEMHKSLLVDGGILSNFPINAWDSWGLPDWPTFGILLDEDIGQSTQFRVGRWPHDYFLALFKTMLRAHDKRYIKPGDYRYRTVKAPVGTIESTDFDLSFEQKEFLFNNGYNAAKTFLETWSWEEYLEWAKKARGIK